MLRSAFVLVAALAVCARAAEDAPPAADCSIYSIEGVRLGMSLDEAKAATPGWTWRKPTKLQPDWWALNGGVLKATGSIRASLKDGRIVRIEREYFDKADVSSVGVEQAFRERFGSRGPETQGRGTTAFDAVTTRTYWVDNECHRMVWVDSGKRFIAMSTGVLESRVLIGGIADLDAAQADVDADAAKVKF